MSFKTHVSTAVSAFATKITSQWNKECRQCISLEVDDIDSRNSLQYRSKQT